MVLWTVAPSPTFTDSFWTDWSILCRTSQRKLAGEHKREHADCSWV